MPALSRQNSGENKTFKGIFIKGKKLNYFNRKTAIIFFITASVLATSIMMDGPTSASSPTAVTGILATSPLTFVQPINVDLSELQIGANDEFVTMTVISNQSWTITVQDGAGNNGYLTKYDAIAYYNTVHLATPLQLIAEGGYLNSSADPTETAPANYALSLTNKTQILANGIPAGQAADGAGESRTIDYHQQVLSSDSLLSSEFSYNTVVSFTCTLSY